MTVEGLDRLLAEHDFFRGLEPEHLSFVAGCGSNVRFAEGDFLFREGEPADRFYIVREGRVALEVRGPGEGALVLDTLGANEVVGVSWLFPPYRWQFDARAVEPVRAVALDGACLREKCDREPPLGYELMKRLSEISSQRMQSARLRMLDLYGRSG
ncbi:MAG TPA: cyclic nucleotide-binding domain-containing protein [Actinomycetota bacterium]